MHLEHYELLADTDYESFQFISEGKRGDILKIIGFQPITDNFFNLSLADIEVETGKINSNIISDNGDMAKVLSTVAAAVYAFTERHPNSLIYLTGSTDSRSRLYGMGISKYFHLLEHDFKILGNPKNSWEEFTRGRRYIEFVIKRK